MDLTGNLACSTLKEMVITDFILPKKILIGFYVFVFLNLLFIDGFLLFGLKKSETKVASQTMTVKQTTEQQLSCPTNCLTAIQNATSSLKKTAMPTPVPQPAGSTVKEYFIPIGGGSGNPMTYTNVNGLQVYVDSSQYGKIKQVLFEASVDVPTANQFVQVRLFNMTAKHPVWFSDLFFPGGVTPMFNVSAPITLDPGNNLYQVQMNTQLGFTANLDQSRIHITTY